MRDSAALRLPAGISAGRFLAEYWQKRALGLPAALPGFRPPLEADEIAGLACEPDVESRLVLTERATSTVRYRVEHGPFDTRRLSTLPNRDWTLLVHDIDRHVPELRPLVFAADFLPAWRMSDLMVSVAAPGGSVGPHHDSYDVFLLQGEGRRIWRLGCGRPGADASGLRLLEDFRTESSLSCESGDVLYLPPGMGHHGVAESFCTTWSLGLQAPLIRDLAIYLDLDPATLPEDLRYADPDLATAEVCGGLISPAAVRRCRRLMPPAPTRDDEEIAEALGRLVTLPKTGSGPGLPDDRDLGELKDAARAGRPLRPTVATAAYATGSGGLLFMGGESFAAAGSAWNLALRLASPSASAGTTLDTPLTGQAASLFETLCRQGFLQPAAP